MTNDAVLWLLVILVAVGLLVWVVQLAAGVILWFTAFVMELPTLVALLLFVLFPPALLVFLVGYALILIGARRDEKGRD